MTNKRKHIRYKPQEGSETVQIDLESKDVAFFTPKRIGLVFDEAFKGCGALFLGQDKFAPGVKCIIKIGQIGPLMAQVVYAKKIDNDLIRVGFYFLD
jgi:hypothetical protein